MFGMRTICKRAAFAFLAFFISGLFVLSCGKKGPSFPPIVVLPGKVVDLKVRQIDDSIILSFLIPDKNTDDSLIQEPLSANVLCYVEEAQENASSSLPSPSDFLKRARVCKRVDHDKLSQRNQSRRIFLEDRIFERYGAKAEGKQFFYAIRLKNERGKWSPLSDIVSLMTGPSISSPIHLRAIVLEEGIKLSWEYPESETGEEEPQLFNVYRMEGTPPNRSMVSETSQKTIPAVQPHAISGEKEIRFLFNPINKKPVHGNTYIDESYIFGKDYLFAVRSVDDGSDPYRESGNSEVVRLQPQDLFAPKSPQGLIAVTEGTVIRLFWYPNSEKDLGGYRIYRESKSMGGFVIIAELYSNITSFTDDRVSTGQTYRYYVTAFDSSEQANESPPTPIISEVAMSPFDRRSPDEEREYEGEP